LTVLAPPDAATAEPVAETETTDGTDKATAEA